MVVLNGRAAPKDKVRFVLALRHSVTSTSGGPAVFQRGAAAIEERRKVITGLFIMKEDMGLPFDGRMDVYVHLTHQQCPQTLPKA